LYIEATVGVNFITSLGVNCQVSGKKEERNITFKRFTLHIYAYVIYRVSQEEWTKFRESVPYVELYRYNTKTPISEVERLRR